MVFLKEDGSLDVERIDNLPLLDYYDALGDLSDLQVEEYCAKLPMNETKEYGDVTKVEFTIKEAIERDIMVDAEEFINKMRKNMLKK
jgi:hypothetical protein